MASGDARPFPGKNAAYRVTFPIFDNDGDLVAGAAALDSEISKDGGTFADCTNEATQIATNSGMYFLDLTAAEMNADTVAIIVKTSSSDAKTTPIVLYPEEAGDIRVDVTQIDGDGTAAQNLRLSAGEMVQGTVDTATFTPTATQFEADDITEATAEHFRDASLIWTSGALKQQRTEITAYALVGGKGKFTVAAMTEAPANNDTFIIV